MLEPLNTQQLGGLALYMDLVPYDIGRRRLYTADDLYGDAHYDAHVYDYYIQHGKQAATPQELMARTLHDYSIRGALERFMEGRDPLRSVGVMGGHGLLRTAPLYRQTAAISKRLTEAGCLMITGGGPGAMEATHLGAWLAGRPESDLDAALDILAATPCFEDAEWVATAMEVRERFPQEKGYESLGVPTWLYGHEPATPFATRIAKLFDNSIREDFILTESYGGIIFTPGSAGTLQEIFQEAVQNHYLSYGFASPMVFLDRQFWTEEVPVVPLINHLMTRGRYKNLLVSLTDSDEEVVTTLLDFQQHTPHGTSLER